MNVAVKAGALVATPVVLNASAVTSWSRSVSPEITTAIVTPPGPQTKRGMKLSLRREREIWLSAFPLIHWRDYHVGGSELERVRDQYLALGFDKEQIEQEYIDAQKRVQANLEGIAVWERKVGIADLAKQRRDTLDEHWAAAEALAEIKPSSVADALALQDFVWANLIELESEHSMDDWEADVL